MTANNLTDKNDSSLKKEQLPIQWTLSETDIETIFSYCNGEQQCLCFALQLCTLRNTGQFLQSYHNFPESVIHYLIQQLELSSHFSFSEDLNKNTESRYQEKIREYLNYSLFNEQAQQKLQEWGIKTLSKTILTHKEFFQEAIQFLKTEKIIPPSKVQLGRFLSTEKQKVVSSLYNKIVSQLTEKQQTFITQLVTIQGI